MGGPEYVVAYHGPEEFSYGNRWDHAGVVRESAFVTAISQNCKAQLQRWVDVADWHKVHIVRCGVNADAFTYHECIAHDAPRVCVVARLEPRKGIPTLLQALKELRSRGIDIHLDIVGDGSQRPALEHLTRELEVRDLVTFHGALDAEGVRTCICASMCLVVPSYSEGLPTVLMESMALGRVVIASWCDGIPELVTHGVNGWLVPPGDEQALADALVELNQTSLEQRNEMGRAARSRAMTFHNIEHETATLSELMGSVFIPHHHRGTTHGGHPEHRRKRANERHARAPVAGRAR